MGAIARIVDRRVERKLQYLRESLRDISTRISSFYGEPILEKPIRLTASSIFEKREGPNKGPKFRIAFHKPIRAKSGIVEHEICFNSLILSCVPTSYLRRMFTHELTHAYQSYWPVHLRATASQLKGGIGIISLGVIEGFAEHAKANIEPSNFLERVKNRVISATVNLAQFLMNFEFTQNILIWAHAYFFSRFARFGLQNYRLRKLEEDEWDGGRYVNEYVDGRRFVRFFSAIMNPREMWDFVFNNPPRTFREFLQPGTYLKRVNSEKQTEAA